MSIFGSCPGSDMIKQPYPEEVKCSCGANVEIWSDEVSAKCKRCNKEVTREMLPSCLDWCKMAKECIGEEKFNRYKKSKGEK